MNFTIEINDTGNVNTNTKLVINYPNALIAKIEAPMLIRAKGFFDVAYTIYDDNRRMITLPQYVH